MMSIKESFSSCSLSSYVPATENRLSGSETLEVIIPDKFPDAAEIISLTGAPWLKSRDEAESITLQTVYELTALVRANDNTLFPISAELPVTIRSSLTYEEGGCVHAVVYSLSRDARIVNSRKLAFSCEVGASLTLWQQRKLDYLDISSPDIIAQKSDEMLLRRAVAICETFFLSDELPLPAGKPVAASIVTKECHWKAEEQRLTSDKLIVRAIAALDVGYLSADGEWNTASFELPFTRVLDLPAVNEDAPYSCRLRMGKITVLPQMRDESAVFAITIGAEAHILCYEKISIYSVKDLYSLHSRLLPTFETIALPSALLSEQGQLTYEETIEFPRDPESIVSFSLSFSPVSVYYKEEGLLQAEATAYASFLYLSGGRLSRLEKKFPVEWTIAVSGTVYSVSVSAVFSRYTLPAMRKSEISLTVDFQLNGEELLELRTVRDIKEEPEDVTSLPAFLYVPRIGSRDLFALGKLYHASPSEIAEINDLDADAFIPAGRPLLIPVFHGKS